MKALLKIFWVLSVVLLACSGCDDDKDPEPGGSLLPQFWEVMSQGGYWSEDIRFVYWEDGQLHISDKDIIEDYRRVDSGSPYPNDVLMDQFYYNPETHYIHRYMLVSGRDEDPVYRYHPNLYWMNPQFQTQNGFFIESRGNYDLKSRNAMSDTYTNLLSVSADEIVVEVPIKSFIYDYWILGHYDGKLLPIRSYLRLRTTWRRITDPERLSQLESATPFDEESPEE